MEERQKKNEEERQDAVKEPVIYQDMLPQEVLEQLTPEVRRQFFIWDEIFKRELEVHPWLVLPLIKEVFHKAYPVDVKARLLSTEYVVDRVQEVSVRALNSIHADILLKVGRDLYHFECQMEKNRDMVLRMLEYDMNIAFVHGRKERSSGNAVDDIELPKSAVIYLNYPERTKEDGNLRIRFSDGSTYLYQPPVLKVQEYTPEMIEEKHLNMLIPFLPIRFKKNIGRKGSDGQKKAVPETVRKELTDLIHKCMMIVYREKENGTLTESARINLLDFLSRSCDYLLRDEPELHMEVRKMMEPAFKLLMEEKEELESKNEELKEKSENLFGENTQLKIKIEKSIRNSIEKNKADHIEIEQTKELLETIFSLTELEAEEMLAKYW
ncbi:MAG: hypothetical protein ACI4ER_05140 [Suilimivivens sp.]